VNRSFGGVAALSVCALAALISMLVFQSQRRSTGGPSSQTELTFYCAAGIRKPVEKVIEDYFKDYGVQVNPSYAGSGALLSKIRGSNLGDLYLAASIAYMKDARKVDLIDEVAHVAKQNLVFVVRKDEKRTKNIKTLEDILSVKNGRIYLADPKVAAIGRAARKMLGEETWKKVWDAKIASVDTVNMVANGITTKVGDIGIVWDATAKQYDNLRAIRIPQFEAKTKQIAISILRSSKHPTQALHFLRYLTARDKGLVRFKEMGYRVVEGDKWSSSPRIKVFAGGLNRPAIEDIIAEFQKREGVTIEPNYNGCGILVGQMKGGTIPDMYFACDTSFMEQVKEHFPNIIDLSGTDMVMIVPKSKQAKLGIKVLKDLAKPGLKVGICSPEHSALGHLSQVLLQKHELWDSIKANLRDSPATADVLVTQVAAGGLDVAIVYQANTTRRTKDIEVIAIQDPLATAVQPIAVAGASDHRHLTNRLLDKIRSAEAKKRFQELGFRWLGDKKQP